MDEDKPKIGMYKDDPSKPTITLNPSSRFPFTFGTKKARQIVDNFEAIKKFAEENQKDS